MPVKVSGSVSDPKTVCFENEFIRMQLGNITNQKAAHLITYKPSNVVVSNLTYGDYCYYSGSMVNNPTSCTILDQTDDKIEIVYEFLMDGIAGGTLNIRDHTGALNYPVSSASPKTIASYKVYKVVKMVAGVAGYWVGFHANPPLIIGDYIEADMDTSNFGEREWGIGWTNTVGFDSNGTVVLNPEAGANTNLGMIAQTCGPWWFASIHTTKPYCMFVSVPRVTPCYIFQAPDQDGIPIVYKMTPRLGADGVVERYQAFYGVFPYTMTNRASEPTSFLVGEVVKRLPNWDFNMKR